MNVRRFFCLACLGVFSCTSLIAQRASSPDNREVTDPKSIVSTPNPDARTIPIEDLYFTRDIRDASWSPDGEQVVFTTNITGRLNLWKVSATGGWPIQLTQSDDRQIGAAWSRDGKWLLFQQDSGGNELWDIYAVPGDGGEVVNLTRTPDIREESPRWSPDGKTIAIAYKPKQSTAYDLALIDWTTRQVKKITHEATPNYSWSSVAWSPDGKTLYANRTKVGFTDSDVYSIDIDSGRATDLTSHQGKIIYVASSLSPDGKTLLITSTEKDGYRNVAFLDITGKKLRWATDIKWEATSGDFSPDGKSYTYLVNADGRQDIYLANSSTMGAEKIPAPEGVNGFSGSNHFPSYGRPSAFSLKGNMLLLSHESSVQPADYWIYDLTRRSTKQLTYSTIASLKSASVPDSQIVHYKSFDGRIISALMWVPFNLKRDSSNPALVLPHGGPTGQTQRLLEPGISAFVSHGYICIAPNVRGSTGYGMEFQKANYQDLGGGDLQDEVFAAKFLEATGYVNPKNIGITGGSYGGFMTLMAIGKAPDVWAAAVELFGIIDWYTMLKHTDPELQEYLRTLLGDPEKDRAAYEAASPIKYVRNAKVPLLVLRGDNDPRVPKEEAQQVVDLLKKDGKTVDVHYYPNEGHGFLKRENQIDSMRRTIDWFDKYLKGHP
jgi:dipeptidyl aminopeptidase/acylaminoacyl peptidase